VKTGRLLPPQPTDDRVTVYTSLSMLFTARRYPIAVLAMALCPFVFVSVTVSAISPYGIKTTGRIELVFGMEASFDLSYTVF